MLKTPVEEMWSHTLFADAVVHSLLTCEARQGG